MQWTDGNCPTLSSVLTFVCTCVCVCFCFLRGCTLVAPWCTAATTAAEAAFLLLQVHDRDAKSLANKLAREGKVSCILIPSDFMALLQGRIGAWWECGHADRYTADSHFSATTTAVFAHIDISDVWGNREKVRMVRFPQEYAMSMQWTPSVCSYVVPDAQSDLCRKRNSVVMTFAQIVFMDFPQWWGRSAEDREPDQAEPECFEQVEVVQRCMCAMQHTAATVRGSWLCTIASKRRQTCTISAPPLLILRFIRSLQTMNMDERHDDHFSHGNTTGRYSPAARKSSRVRFRTMPCTLSRGRRHPSPATVGEQLDPKTTQGQQRTTRRKNRYSRAIWRFCSQKWSPGGGCVHIHLLTPSFSTKERCHKKAPFSKRNRRPKKHYVCSPRRQCYHITIASKKAPLRLQSACCPPS